MKNRRARCQLAFLLLLFLLVILAALSVSVGSVSLSFQDIQAILSGADRESTAFHILWDIRLPRLLAAALLGGALSASGFLLQTFFANPIAGPFVLGISSGAKLVVALVMIRGHDSGGLCRIYDFHGLCAGDRKAGAADVRAGGMRCHDQLYLFRDYGFCGDLCG